MFKTVITFKKDTDDEMLKRLKLVCTEAFDNRAGKVELKEEDKYTVYAEGEYKDWVCLNLGSFTLDRTLHFNDYIESWDLIDYENPAESCDLTELYKKPVYNGRGGICKKKIRENKLLSI